MSKGLKTLKDLLIPGELYLVNSKGLWGLEKNDIVLVLDSFVPPDREMPFEPAYMCRFHTKNGMMKWYFGEDHYATFDYDRWTTYFVRLEIKDEENDL